MFPTCHSEIVHREVRDWSNHLVHGDATPHATPETRVDFSQPAFRVFGAPVLESPARSH